MEDAFSALIDWRPVKRVDLYAGVMVSNVYGGLANGFQAIPEHRPDCRPARQVLTHGSYLPPPRRFCRRGWDRFCVAGLPPA